eukprot:3423265-Prymnesium_polylepis.1
MRPSRYCKSDPPNKRDSRFVPCCSGTCPSRSRCTLRFRRSPRRSLAGIVLPHCFLRDMLGLLHTPGSRLSV